MWPDMRTDTQANATQPHASSRGVIWRGLFALLLLAALTLSSFGHRSLSPNAAAEAQAYILAGGDWASLCGESGDPLAATEKCRACVIAQTFALPAQCSPAQPLGRSVRIVWPSDPAGMEWAVQYASYPARAPPFV